MNDFYILAPEATENLIVGGSFESSSLTVNNVSTGSSSTVTTQSCFGPSSRLVSPASGTNDGVYIGNYTLTSSLPYTFSMYVLGVLGVPYRVYFANTSGTLLGTATNFTGTGQWQRIEVTYTPGTTTVRVYITKNGSSASGSAGQFYLDGLQLEQKAYATSYVDGDQDGCTWVGAPHQSTSKRAANVRSGGKLVYLSDYGASVVDISGLGAAPVETTISPFADMDGGAFQRQITRPRQININLSVVGGAAGDEATWHTNLDELWDLVKPDLVSPQQPFVLGYRGIKRHVRIKCFIDGDFSLQGEKGKDISVVSIRCTAPDPYWYSEHQFGQVITPFIAMSATADRGLVYRDALTGWGDVGGINGPVYALAVDPTGQYLYIGGNFTTVGGVSYASIVRYDGTSFSALGTGTTGIVRALACTPDGTLYVGGNFTTIGGVACNRVAKWNGSAFSALSTGVSGGTPEVYALAYDTINNYMWVGGTFTSAGGVGSTTNLAYWDISASSWGGHSLSLAGVTAMMASPDGRVYLNDGNSTVPLAEVTDGTFTGLTNGFTNGLFVMPDSSIYIVGTFTTVDGMACDRIAKWDGTAWGPVGLDTDANITAIYADSDGQVYLGDGVGGDSHVALDFYSPVTYRQGAWVREDIKYGYNLSLGVNVITKFKDRIFYGTTNTPVATNGASGSTATVTNNGSATTFPKIVFSASGSGRAMVRLIRNNTTNKLVTSDIVYSASERITFDFTPGVKSIISNTRGRIVLGVFSGSSMGSFALAPGSNSISLFAIGVDGAAGGSLAATPSATMLWNERYWSYHGAER